MPFLSWLPDCLRDAGVSISVLPGAERRSTNRSGLARVNGVVWHDTVTPLRWSDAAVIRLLRDGHANLRGPLSQVGVDRAGTWNIVALGKCSHNGYGLWGNDAIGLEFFNAGGNVGEVNPPAQVESGVIGTAAILRHLGIDERSVKGHKETDPRRKIDPHALDMHQVRARIAARLANPTTSEEDPMADTRGVARMNIREFLGRSPKDYDELDFHANLIGERGLNGYIEWLEGTDEAKAWAKRIGAEVQSMDPS